MYMWVRATDVLCRPLGGDDLSLCQSERDRIKVNKWLVIFVVLGLLAFLVAFFLGYHQGQHLK